MTKSGCFALAYRAHELKERKVPFIKAGECNSWDEVCWYFLFLWGEPIIESYLEKDN